jgi:hypothetical protein
LLKPNPLRLPKLLLLLHLLPLHLLLLLLPQPRRKKPRKTPKAIKKPKLLRSNPYRFTSIRIQGALPGEVLVDDEALYVGRRRPEIVHDLDHELSDYVQTRLLLARMLAIKKYHEKWG